jgi:Leucine-rich repeat (LRR) protein
LYVFSIQFSGLEEVPLRVFQIVDLVDLSLAGNKISSLPDDIKNLVNLRRLGLAGNRLQELPASIDRKFEAPADAGT